MVFALRSEDSVKTFPALYYISKLVIPCENRGRRTSKIVHGSSYTEPWRPRFARTVGLLSVV